jgi:transcriptional regulator with XRE-family HTH domain
MKVHRGKIAEKAVRESGISLTSLAERLSVSRRTLYNYFLQQDLSIHTMLAIGKIIHVDFSKLLPKDGYIIPAPQIFEVNDSQPEKGQAYWKDKYYTLLEKHNELLVQQLNKKK